MKKILSLLLCITVVFVFPVAVYADMGPKPSVRITFEGMEAEREYYGTLLSEQRSTGPSSAWDGVIGNENYDDGEKEIWQAFVDYTDTDGYYFLQEIWNCTETNQLNWTYYPPSSFKILLWFPKTDTYLVSGIYERYAFDSYYTVDLSDFTEDSVREETNTGMIVAKENYNFTWEIISLLVRIAATVMLETAIAFIFGYREKKAVKFVAAINIITQVLLNVALNIINYNMGSMAFTFFFIVLEFVVFAVEAVVFALLLKRFTDKNANKARTTAYAFAANAASLAVGLWLSHIIPGIF